MFQAFLFGTCKGAAGGSTNVEVFYRLGTIKHRISSFANAK
ncbi:hypothetical protein A2U01_0049251, partial [Trifolium medium]|nr:hypothetical protein [Trifolium medium]